METMVMVNESEDRQISDLNGQLDAARAEAKELEVWQNFGTIGYAAYVEWVLQNLAVRG
jgi:hypothetical protein